jgi:hypothetical protein
VVDNTINISKVWTQVNEYPGTPNDWKLDDTIQLKEIMDKNNKFQYYAYGWQKDAETFIEYYKHGSLTTFERYYEPWNIYKSKNQNYLILQGERTLYNNPAIEGNTSILYPTYKITSKYSMYNMNNTIACTIRKDRMIYTTEKEFTFGTSGTMGSDKSIVIDFVGGQTAIIPGSSEAY